MKPWLQVSCSLFSGSCPRQKWTFMDCELSKTDLLFLFLCIHTYIYIDSHPEVDRVSDIFNPSISYSIYFRIYIYIYIYTHIHLLCPFPLSELQRTPPGLAFGPSGGIGWARGVKVPRIGWRHLGLKTGDTHKMVAFNRENDDKPMDLGVSYFQTKPYLGCWYIFCWTKTVSIHSFDVFLLEIPN